MNENQVKKYSGYVHYINLIIEIDVILFCRDMSNLIALRLIFSHSIGNYVILLS